MLSRLFDSFARSIALLLPLLATGVCAQTLDPIYVIGEDVIEVGEVEHSEFTGSHTSLSAEQIEQEVAGLGPLLAHESGIQFKQSGGVGSYSSISVRAASAAQTNVFLDGVLLNNASSGAVDLSQLELLNLSRIDVYRGATPLQLGISNIGGAVNLRSGGNEASESRIRLGFGSFDERNVHISAQTDLNGWKLSTKASRVMAKNNFTFNNENGTPLNLSDDKREKRNNSDFSRNAFLLKLSNNNDQSNQVDAMLQYTEREQGLPHWANRSDTQTQIDNNTLQLQVNRRFSAEVGSDWNHSEGLYFNRSVEAYDDSYSQIGLGVQSTKSISNLIGLKSYWEKINDTGTFSLHVDGRQELLEQEDKLGGSNAFSASRREISSAAQYSLFAFNDKLLLTPSLRWQGISDNYDGVLRSGKNSNSQSDATAQIGMRWEHSEQLTLSANAGQHNREPVFFELFGDRGLYLGNASLKPEKGTNVDVGVQWLSASLPGSSLNVTGFASFRDELIVSVYDSRGIGRSVNSGKAQVLGVEFDSQLAIKKHWQFKLNMTWQSAENLSNANAFNGKQLPGEAQFAGYAQLRYHKGPYKLWYESDFMQQRFYDTANLLAAEDFVVHSLGFSMLYKKLHTVLLLKNLTDVQTEDYNGFPKPGRSFHINFTYNFQRRVS